MLLCYSILPKMEEVLLEGIFPTFGSCKEVSLSNFY